MRKRLIAVIVAVMCIAVHLFSACGSDMATTKRNLRGFEFTKASFSATDRLGREITPMHAKKTDHDRYVGVFYFLWLGTHLSSAGVYDTTKLLDTQAGKSAIFDVSLRLGQKIPGTVNAKAGYPDGMESPANYVHFTTEPLYGYYNTADAWVITRHMELLAMADVDFIYLDTTNEYTYAANVHSQFVSDPTDAKNVALSRPTYTLLDTVLALQNAGWDVPKVVFYTNTRSGDMVDKIYNEFYADGKYDSIWFAPDGKPLIVGTTENNSGTDARNEARADVSDAMQSYFDVRESQWPNQGAADNGFPWMDWSKGNNYYYPQNKMVNVSVAQHGANETAYSAYAYRKSLYGDDIAKYRMDGRSSRGWIDATDTVGENWQAGQNAEDQWETVFAYESQGKTIEMVTVTGWNEWLAWKMCNEGSDHPLFVDNFSAEFSRDMEPDRNTYQDNFYLQLVRNVRKYKYTEQKGNYAWEQKTVRSFADFEGVQSKYLDFVGDAIKRDFYGFDIRPGSRQKGLLGAWYTDTSNRNDIVSATVVHDSTNVYFCVETVADVTPYEGGENWMNILIQTKASTAAQSWEGYDYLINRNPADGKASVERSRGGWDWQETGRAQTVIEGNKMWVTVPLSALGLAKGDTVAFSFKVADNVTAYTDIMDYYVSGDSAPIGRLKYSYGY